MARSLRLFSGGPPPLGAGLRIDAALAEVIVGANAVVPAQAVDLDAAASVANGAEAVFPAS